MNLDEKTLSDAWDILIAEAGASDKERERRQFVSYFLTAQNPEWRFMGKLGSGGKVRFNGDYLYVTCYLEQETPERLEIIEKVNEKLLALKF